MLVLIGGEKGGPARAPWPLTWLPNGPWQAVTCFLSPTRPPGIGLVLGAAFGDEAGITPRVACVQKSGGPPNRTEGPSSGSVSDIIIDAGGRDSVELRVSLVVLEKRISPCRPHNSISGPSTMLDELVATAQIQFPPCAGSCYRPAPPLIHWSRRLGRPNDPGGLTRISTVAHTIIIPPSPTGAVPRRVGGQRTSARSQATAEISWLYKEVFDGAEHLSP